MLICPPHYYSSLEIYAHLEIISSVENTYLFNFFESIACYMQVTASFVLAGSGNPFPSLLSQDHFKLEELFNINSENG
jgi:hypothetical protein